jgi:hypothetical protein
MLHTIAYTRYSMGHPRAKGAAMPDRTVDAADSEQTIGQARGVSSRLSVFRLGLSSHSSRIFIFRVLSLEPARPGGRAEPCVWTPRSGKHGRVEDKDVAILG